MSNVITPTEAFHGTYRENLDSIINIGFRDSIDHHQWYGDGTYFFVHGLGNPVDAAMQYAKDKAYQDKSEKECCVLQVLVNVNSDTELDLTTVDGIEIFNSFKEEVIEGILKKGKKFHEQAQDHHIMNHLRQDLGIEFVKGHVYIKFGTARKINFGSKIPNITIFVVTNASKNVERSSITCL